MLFNFLKARGTVTEQKIRNWFLEVKDLLGEDVNILEDPKRIFNMDESGFYLCPDNDYVLGPRGENVYSESANSDKENCTTLMTVNAAGETFTPLTLYQYKRLPNSVIQAAPPAWAIGKTDSGWMNAESFYEQIANVFYPELKRKEENNELSFPVIVFLDGHKSHLSLSLSHFCRDKKIILVALYPNSTHILQPLDVAVFGPMKRNWKRTVRAWRIDHDGNEITKFDIPQALSQIIRAPNAKKNIIAGIFLIIVW